LARRPDDARAKGPKRDYSAIYNTILTLLDPQK